MERSRFIETAPYYYALAVASYFAARETASQNMVRSSYALPGQLVGFNDEEVLSYLDNEILFRKAIDILVERSFLTEVPDDFGPAIYRKAEDFDDAWSIAEKDSALPFGKYGLVNDGQNWLRAALASVNAEYAALQITETDFEGPYDEWEPLPLDRSDPKLRTVIERVADIAEQVRTDNGYAATVPQERSYVLTELNKFSEIVKNEEQVSVGFIRRYALEPLITVGKRFKGHAIGIAAIATSGAIVEWLKGMEIDGLKRIAETIKALVGL
jgi:hypothetical protein